MRTVFSVLFAQQQIPLDFIALCQEYINYAHIFEQTKVYGKKVSNFINHIMFFCEFLHFYCRAFNRETARGGPRIFSRGGGDFKKKIENFDLFFRSTELIFELSLSMV